MFTGPTRTERRVKLVREHLAAVNAHDFDAAIANFARPRYEIIATGDVYDGEAAVRRYYDELRAAFPDRRTELIRVRQAEDAVIAEFWLLGTHGGAVRSPLGETPPEGKSFKERLCAIFEFEDDRLVCERIYFDRLSILSQITTL